MKGYLTGIVILTFALTQAVSAVPAFAAASGNVTPARPEVKASVIKGIVKAVSASTITVGNTTVVAGNETRINIPGQKGARLADIKPGMNVVIEARKNGDALRAGAINVVPVVSHFVGNVTAYTYVVSAGGSISIASRDGKKYTFRIAVGAFTIEPKGAVVRVGEQVTVLTRRLKEGDDPVAFGVVVSPRLERFAGNVTAFTYDKSRGGSISIVEKGGRLLTFNITAGKFTVQPRDASAKVGQRVIVTVQVQPAGGQKVAIGVEIIMPAQRFTGNVTEFRYDPDKGGKISIVEKGGKRLNFDIKAGHFTVLPKGVAVKTGDAVTVVARVEEGNHLVATGVVILPKPVMVSGIINRIDEAGRTITIGTTNVTYTDKTVFSLRGTLSVRVGLQAVARGYERPDHTVLANSVAVTIPR